MYYELKLHGVTVDTKLSLEQVLQQLAESVVSRFFKQVYLIKKDGTKSLVSFKFVTPEVPSEVPTSII